MAASRSPGLAIATASAIALSAGALYYKQKGTKGTEGRASIYQPDDAHKTVGKTGDEHLSPKAVSEVVTHGGTGESTSKVKPAVVERK